MEAPRDTTMKFFLAWAAAGLLAACAAGPAPVDDTPGEVSRARRALDTGDYRAAAEWWQDAAAAAADPQRNDYLLQAAEAWFAAKEPANARAQLNRVSERQLAAAARSRYALLNADFALTEADVERAEFYLEAARASLHESQRARYQGLVDRLDRLRADPGSFALAAAAALLETGGGYDVQQGVTILRLLEEVPSGILRDIPVDAARSYGLAGWPDLAVTIRETLVNGVPLPEAAARWGVEHPGHEVTDTGFVELAAGYRRLFALPSNIAVLLPGSGGLGAAGNAIRDGLVSAFLESGQLVSLRFYPTSDEPGSAVSAYFEALGEGAQWIIGPLRRESVQEMLELGSLGLPLLALNDIGGAGARSDRNLLFGLSLSQEQEAKAIAQRALANGWTSAATLHSDNSWGQRMEAAFREEFTASGGVIVAGAAFDTAESDHSPLLTDLLKIDESIERKNRLQATLGVSLEFEPTRRDDFDLFFLAADAEQGRQIRPQLRFHDAGRIPVMAMGRIYAGIEDRAADQDLDGVIFPSTRWQLQTRAEPPAAEFSSLRGGGLAPLYALGMDAWELLPWLTLMQKDPDLQIRGHVGRLSMRPDGQMLREPAWAHFARGRAEPVEFAGEAGESDVPVD